MLFKQKMFERLDSNYGLNDEGLLTTYLGVQFEQKKGANKIHQTKYSEEIIERFDFSKAHLSRKSQWKQTCV